MDYNTLEIKKKIVSLIVIVKSLEECYNNHSMTIPKHIATKKRSILDMYGLLHFQMPGQYMNKLANEINSLYAMLKEEIDSIHDNQPLLTSAKFHQVSAGINQYTNNMHARVDTIDNCPECMVKYESVNSITSCPQCLRVKGKTYKFSSVSDNNDEIRQTKNNIAKHYEETIAKLYGNTPKGAILPNEVIVLLRAELAKRGNIMSSTHYTNTLLNMLQQIGTIKHNGVTYQLKKYKEHANFLLRQLYPEVKIPVLSIAEACAVKHVFMNISAVFQQLYSGHYANNYMYTIFKIIYMTMPYKKHARHLLRFIYIQQADSFGDKDTKLAAVNEKMNIFGTFIYTHPQIYDKEEFYLPEVI